MCAATCSRTEVPSSKALTSADEKQRPAVYVFPTESDWNLNKNKQHQ